MRVHRLVLPIFWLLMRGLLWLKNILVNSLICLNEVISQLRESIKIGEFAISLELSLFVHIFVCIVENQLCWLQRSVVRIHYMDRRV